eukprot:gene6769-13718_t
MALPTLHQARLMATAVTVPPVGRRTQTRRTTGGGNHTTEEGSTGTLSAGEYSTHNYHPDTLPCYGGASTLLWGQRTQSNTNDAGGGDIMVLSHRRDGDYRGCEHRRMVDARRRGKLQTAQCKDEYITDNGACALKYHGKNDCSCPYLNFLQLDIVKAWVFDVSCNGQDDKILEASCAKRTFKIEYISFMLTEL